MMKTLLTLLAVGIAAIVALSIIGAVIGLAFGIVSLLLFKVVPVLLVGYVVLRLLAPKPKTLSAEDRKWLES